MSNQAPVAGSTSTSSGADATQEERRFRMLVESLDVIVWEMDLKSWLFTYVSPRAVEMLGYPLERWYTEKGFWAEKLVHPEDQSWAVPFCMAATEEGRDHEFDYRAVASDGRVVWLRDVVRVVTDDSGRPVLRGVMMDITEQKETTRIQEEQSRHMRLAARIGSAVSEGGPLRQVLQGCAEAIVEHLDAAFARIWTLNEAEQVLELQASAGLYTHLDGPHGRVPVGAFKIGKIAQERAPHLTNDVQTDERVGDKEWARREGMVAFAGYPLITEGRLVGVIAMFARHALPQSTIDALREVADRVALMVGRREAEAALQLREEQLSEAQRIANLGSWEWDVATDRMTWSDELYRLYGLEPGSEASTLQAYLARVHPDDRQRVEETLREAHRSGTPFDFEERIVRPEGETRVLRSRGRPVTGERGAVIRLLGICQDVTEHREAAERELRLAREQAAREQVTSVLESITDAFFAVDREWNFTYMNSQAAPLLQRSRDELIGRNLWEEFPEAVETVFYEMYHRAVREQRTVEFETYYPPLAGWFEVRAYPSRDGGLSVYFQNVTSRKEAEEALRKQSELTRTITDNATSAQFMMDARGHCTYMNPAAEQMIGFTLDEIRDIPLHDAIHHHHPDGRPYPLSECPIDRALPEDNSVRAHEDVFIRKDGTFFPVVCAASPIFENGVPVGTVVEVRDVTDLRRRQAEIEFSEQRYRSLAEATAAIVWSTGPSGRFETQQPRWSEFTGQGLDEYLGEGWADAIHPSDRAATLAGWKEALQTLSPFESEQRVRRRDGQYRHMLVRAIPILGPDNEVREWIGTHTDITERKTAEQRSLAQHATMRALVESESVQEAYRRTLAALGENLGWDIGCLWRLDEEAEVLRCEEVWQAEGIDGDRFEQVSREMTLVRGEGLPGRVWREGSAIWIRDVERDPNFPRAGVAARTGVHAAFGFPICIGPDVFGVVEFFAREIAEPDDTLLRAVESTGNAIGQYLQRTQVEKEREGLIRALEAERARLTRAFREAPAFIGVYGGPDHVINMVNPVWERLAGRHNVLGKTFREVFPELEGTGLFELLDQVYQSGEPYVGNELPVLLDRKGDGQLEQSYWNFVWQPLTNEMGEVSDIFVHAVEVTDQVNARRAVEQLEERLRLALESANTGTWDFDLVANALSWDDRTKRIFGFPVDEEIDYARFEARVHPDDRERTNRLVSDAIAPEGTGAFDTEYRIVDEDGSVRWIRATGRALFEGAEETRRAVRFLGTVRDVTSQKETEAERERLIRDLDTERGRLRHIFQEAPAFIATLRGTNHVFETVNPPYMQLIGNRDVVGKPVAEALPEVVEQGFVTLLDQVYQSGEPFIGNEVPVLLQPVPGAVPVQRYVNFVYQPLVEADGSVSGIFVHGVDVTDQVQARQEVERKAEELARVARALEMSNRELDQFAYVASHDLKAPLRGIANLSQWIEEDLGGQVNEEIREHLDLLRGRVHRMEGLIDGILQYSRAGRVRESPEEVRVRSLLEEVVDLLAPREELEIRIAEEMPTMMTERLPLQQVFMNLIGNAAKYNSRPDGRIEVGAEERGEWYEFYVADNGPGIAPDYHDRIFGIFQTLEARDKVEGTGIGLSLVKKLVESRGGRVWVESEVGAGATFRFLWPRQIETEI